ncbi:hypothetical protein DYH09_23845 [bacterium CPR1]|nr:hypothetical protein [bacterium CPR1]
MRGAILLLLLLGPGCASPRAEQQIEQTRQHVVHLESELKEIEAVLPVIEERHARVKRLKEQRARLLEEINALRKKKAFRRVLEVCFSSRDYAQKHADPSSGLRGLSPRALGRAS